MLHIAAIASFLIAGHASAQDQALTPQQVQELQADAALLQSLSDKDFLTTAARKADDGGAGDNSGVNPADVTDGKLSRPRTLEMIYETLAANEYQQADQSGLLQGADATQVSKKAKMFAGKPSLLIDPKTQKASRAYSRISSRLQGIKSAPTAAGRSVPANKRMAALNKSLMALQAKLGDNGTPAAQKASLHAQVGKVYERMAAAAKIQGAIQVVDASVMDDDDGSSTASAGDGSGDDSADHPSGKKSKVAAKPAAKVSSDKLQRLADKLRSLKKGDIIVKVAAKPAAAKAAKAGKAASVRSNKVSRLTALRSVYRQMAARDYRACLSESLPKSSKARIMSSLRRLSVAGERAAWKGGKFSDDIAPDQLTQACGCPTGTEPMGADSYDLCYCADPRDSDPNWVGKQFSRSIEGKLSNLAPAAAKTAEKIASSNEAPKASKAAGKVSAKAEGNYRLAQLHERMAAALTRPAFPATPIRNGKPDLSRLPSAKNLQKLATALRSGMGPVYVARPSRKGGYRSARLARSFALKRAYQLMAALDYRASLIGGLPAQKSRKAAASLRSLSRSMIASRVGRKARKGAHKARKGARKAGAKFADDEDDGGGGDYSGGGDDSSYSSGGGDDTSYSSGGDDTSYSGGGDDSSSGGGDDSSVDDSAYAGATDTSLSDSGGDDSSMADTSGGDSGSGGDDSSMADSSGGDSGSGGDDSSMADSSGGDSGSGGDGSSLADSSGGDSGSSGDDSTMADSGGDSSGDGAFVADGSGDSSGGDSGSGDQYANTTLTDSGDQDPNGGTTWGDLYASTSGTDDSGAASDDSASDTSATADASGGDSGAASDDSGGDSATADASGGDTGATADDSGATADSSGGSLDDATASAGGDDMGTLAPSAGGQCSGGPGYVQGRKGQNAASENENDICYADWADPNNRNPTMWDYLKNQASTYWNTMQESTLGDVWRGLTYTPPPGLLGPAQPNPTDQGCGPNGTAVGANDFGWTICGRPDGSTYYGVAPSNHVDTTYDQQWGQSVQQICSGAEIVCPSGWSPSARGCVDPNGNEHPCRMIQLYRKPSAVVKAACPAKSQVVHSTKAGFTVCSLQRKAKIAGLARKSRKGKLLHHIATMDRKANKISGLLLAKATPASRKAELFFQRAQLYQRMAAAIPVRGFKARKSQKVAGVQPKAKVVADAPNRPKATPPFGPKSAKSAKSAKAAKVADDAAPDAGTAPDTVQAAPAPAPAPVVDPIKQAEQEMDDTTKQMQQEIDRRRGQMPQ